LICCNVRCNKYRYFRPTAFLSGVRTGSWLYPTSNRVFHGGEHPCPRPVGDECDLYNTSGKKPADERIFTIAQYIVILSGAMGFILVFNLEKSEIILKNPRCMFLFLYYLFLVLVLFSGSTLFYNRLYHNLYLQLH